MARSLTALLPRIGPRSVQRRHAQLPPPELRRTRRTRWLIAGVAVGAVLFLLVSVLVAQLGKRDAETETGVVAGERDAASGQAVAASIPVVQLCEEPSAVGEALRADPRNPCQLAQQVVADPIPTAVPRDGADGSSGRDGVDGRAGRDGVDGQTPPCLAEPQMCRGADAPPATDGVDGVDGQDGADGQDGRDGADGQNGADGRPPAGFTFVDGSGTRQICTRDPGSPDDAATYTCSPVTDEGAETPSGFSGPFSFMSLTPG